MKPWFEIIIDTAVSIGNSVVGFVGDDNIEIIGRKAVQPSDKALHTCRHDFLTVAVVVGLLNTEGAVKILAWLPHQFLTVGKDQHTSSPPDVRKDNGLTQARGNSYKIRTAFGIVDDIHALLLVVSEGNCLHSFSFSI